MPFAAKHKLKINYCQRHNLCDRRHKANVLWLKCLAESKKKINEIAEKHQLKIKLGVGKEEVEMSFFVIWLLSYPQNENLLKYTLFTCLFSIQRGVVISSETLRQNIRQISMQNSTFKFRVKIFARGIFYKSYSQIPQNRFIYLIPVFRRRIKRAKTPKFQNKRA